MQRDTEDTLPLSDDDERDTRLSPVEVGPAQAHSSTRRKRLWQVGIALATVLAVLVVFRGVYSPRQTPAPPAPTERAISPPLALFASNVNFGAMIINNRLFEKQPVLLPVSQDAYTVTLAASPFHAVTCHVSHLHSGFPDVGPDQHCQESDSLGLPTMTLNGITGSPTFIISLLLGPDDLPPEQQAAVRSTIMAQTFTLHQQTTVPTGDYYAAAVDQNGNITSRRATRPLQAEVSLVSPLGIRNIGPYFCNSDVACPGPTEPGFFPSTSARDWLLQVNAAVRWRFTTSAGQVMGEAAYGAENPTYRFFSYDATNGWQLDEAASRMLETPDELGNDNCVAGTGVLQSLTQGSSSFSINFPASIEGCFLTINNNTASQERLLWRFGVLLAADQNAHTSFPTLPVAPQQEVDAVGG